MSTNLLDVLIVGAGPVGLFCANELSRQGLNCRIVEKKSALSDHSKALAIHIRSLDLLKDCGFLDDFESQGLPIEGMIIKSKGKQLINANLSDLNENHHHLIALPQDKTERIFYQGLKEKGLEVTWNTELIKIEQCPTNVLATLQKSDGSSELVRASWLIACDGAHSTLRKLVYADFRGSNYGQTWWLVDLHIDWDQPKDKMIAYLSDEGPLACFPMGSKRYRLVMTAPLKTDSKTPTMEDIEEIFKRRCSDQASLSNPIWLSKFGIAERQIQKYRYERIFFAGDAAHIHSPMGGQGLNTGLQDIYNLAWKLALVHKNLAKEELLNSYQLERFPIAKNVLKKTGITTKMILLKNPILVALRNRFLKLVFSIKTLRKSILRDLAELDISYAASPITAVLGKITEFNVGLYLTDLELTELPSQEKKLLAQIIQGRAHHLFLFAGPNNSQFGNLAKIAESVAIDYQGLVQTHLIVTQPTAKTNESYSLWLDINQDVHKKYNIQETLALMIRPDKYLGLSQSPFNADELLQHLEKSYINKCKKA
ncbi:MAG: FAD-dependent monooxygenase [Tatlockia sp.]|nr:FAD-dependent monooxygenase [Tatlockia sp.]